MPGQDDGTDAWWIATLTWLWKNKTEIGRKLEELRSWWAGTNADKYILFLGSGGVGKSTLGRLLRGDYEFPIECPGEYEESHRTEVYEIGGTNGPQAEVHVPPGQSYKRDATWAYALADVVAGKFRGIVVINAFGYHSLGDLSFKEHKLYTNSKRDFLSDYLDSCRKDEITVLESLMPQIDLCRERLWLLSLTTKEDLWWSNRKQVSTHYCRGDYGSRIQSLSSAMSDGRVRHEYAFASLAIANFKTGRDELLQKNCAGYDQLQQANSIRRLFELLDALREWEMSK